MENLKKKHIVFLSIGAYATKRDLIYSQMVKFAIDLNNYKYFKSTSSLIVLPYISVLRRFKTHKKNVKSFNHNGDHNIRFFYSWLLDGKMYSFIFKSFFYKLLGNKIYKKIQNLNNDEIIFHCRSYYATDFMIYFKAKYSDFNIKVVFDMRSLVPPEFAYTSKLFGKYLYTSGKEWERSLLKNSDLTLIVTKNAIQLLMLEDSTYKKINYIPIIGFSRYLKTKDIQLEFETRWNYKQFSYIGSIGLWHTLESIESVYQLLKRSLKDEFEFTLVSSKPTLNSKLVQKSFLNDEMPIFYKSQLAIVIPGNIKEIDYFKSLQMTSNLFSTKAAEALSLGVPLIVNKQISELANIVIENDCGIVFEYDLTKKEIVFTNTDYIEMNRKLFWNRITQNAYKLSNNYSKESTEEKYLKYWSTV